MAFRKPVEHYGVMARATALVEFDEALPAHSLETNLRVFAAAEKVFRARCHLPESEIGVRESDLVQAINEPAFDGTVPDGKSPGARVWLSLA
ncbi:hypothetical protein [Chthoniobacter flavus]|uniref:hypothetical protein n=1 Tax=Chthoniobacter flavus TaxID=191863 RepID=UPI000320030E|nr:hypothetical protein [Chthoniobacter flavus]